MYNTSIPTSKERESCYSNRNSRMNKNKQNQQRGAEVFENEHKKDNTAIFNKNNT
jgi:hypothetical protein